MNSLILYIIISAFLYVVFRMFKTYNVKVFQAIFLNYLVCCIMGVFFTGFSEMGTQLELAKPALPYALVLGFLFISVFNLIGKTTHHFGVAITSISDKLSMILPVIFAFAIYGESVTLLKVIGVILSIVAVFLAVMSPNKEQASSSKNLLWLPVGTFIGAGLIGILLNEVQRIFTEINFNTFLILLFGVAFIIGAVIFIIQLLQGKTKFEAKSIIAGLALGIPNYASMVAFFGALDTSGLDSSVIFPVMNIGIVVLSSIIGIFVFKEQSSRQNKIGLLLSIIAISLLLIEQVNG